MMGGGQQDWCVGACTFGVLQMGFCNNDGSAGLLWHLEKTVNVNGHKYTTVQLVEIQDTRTGLNLCNSL